MTGLKILINAVAAKSGGSVSYIRNLMGLLAKEGQGNQYVVLVPQAQAKHLGDLGENITVVPTAIAGHAEWKRLLWDQVSLRRILKKRHIDVLLTSNYGVLSPPCKQILSVESDLYFSPLYMQKVLPRKSLKYKAEFLIRRRLTIASVKSSHLIMCATHSMLNDLREYVRISENSAMVNPFGVSLERFAWSGGPTLPPIDSNNGALDILHVSQYYDHKNLTTLLRAMLMMQEQGIDGFRLVTTAHPEQFPNVEMAGRKTDQALASHPLLNGRVVFTGPVPYEEVHRLYQKSTLFVFPSLTESFGHPLVEAMASGLGIVASDIPTHREVCGDAALYFNPLEPQDLVQKLLLLKGSPELRKELSERGQRRAASQFRWDDYVERLMRAFDRVGGHG